MSTSLQAIAESLGQRPQRSVAIDDPSLHLLAHSPHYDEAAAASRQADQMGTRST